jgi:hypothetical protein
LQIRALFSGEPNAAIRAVTAYYLPQNQRPVVTEVGLKARTTKRATSGSSEPREVDVLPTPSPMLGLTWKIDNPDSDRLRYRLRYREENQTLWREMLREHEMLTATEHTWNTSAIPDGHYVIQVEASDELGNPLGLSLRSTFESEPILVDNHAPTIERLAVNGARITGRAVDTLGPIARLEYAVDGGEWELFFPEDDLLDTREESFVLDLSSRGAGAYLVAVRATDAAGNVGAAEIEVRVPATPRTDAPAARPRRTR